MLIAGGCDDWEKYQKMIKHPQLFDLRIRRIEDREIPDLFTEAHYFVAPYQDIAQSGSAIIAINYNMPVVASKLEAFESYITDKETGFLIKPADQSELKNVICYILQNHNDYYDQMCKRISNIKEEKFSANAVEKLYAKNFETVLGQKL